MALLSGSFTFKKFRLGEDLPSNFKEVLVQALPRYSFREIDPKVNPEFSIGWINAFDPMDTHLALEKVLFGKYILLGIRRDHKSVSAALLKAQISAAVKAQLRERRGRKLSREDMITLKEDMKEKIMATVSPSVAFYEMVWNYETQEIYFSTQSAKAATEFMDLFQETFELSLEEVNLVTRAEEHLLESGRGLEMIDLEPAHFGS